MDFPSIIQPDHEQAACQNVSADLLRLMPESGVSLMRGENTRLVCLGIDGPNTDHPQFSPDGRLFAWVSGEGTVFIGELGSIRRRLANVGLGW